MNKHPANPPAGLLNVPREKHRISERQRTAAAGFSALTAGTALLLLLGATSCSSSRSNVPAPVTVPARFSAFGEAILPDRWWLSFNDPALSHLIEQALSNNLNLRIVWDRLAQAEAVARRAGAPLWPSLDAQAAASRTVERGPVQAGGGVKDTTYRTGLSLGLVASYEVDLWGRIRSMRDAAALDVQATREQVQAAAITLSAQVAAVWYALVEQYGQVELLQRQLGINEDVLELITLRFRRGQVGAADVLRQRQLVEARRGDIATAESRVAVLEHQLAILLGQEPTVRVAERAATLPSLPELPSTGVPAEVIQRRPDVQQASYAVLAADRRVAAAIADRFPRIGLTAQANTSGQSTRDLFDNWLASLAANLTAPLFDGGERRAEVDRTRAVLSERLHAYGQTILESLGEVENALAQERQQQEFLASLENQLELASQVIQRVRDSYTKGAADYLRVLDALLTQQSLQRTLLQSRRLLIEYRIDLCRALGGGWSMTRPGLAVPPPGEGPGRKGATMKLSQVDSPL